MNPPESLLQAAHRDSDPTAALACADWYDDAGQPEQARLMRLSVEREQLGPGHPDAMAIEQEAERLFRDMIVRQLWPVIDSSAGYVPLTQFDILERGLLSNAIARDLSTWIDQLDRVFAQSTARSLIAGQVSRQNLRKLTRGPIAARLAGLTLTPPDSMRDQWLTYLTGRDSELRLIRLELRLRAWQPEIAVALATAQNLAGLRSLMFSGGIGDIAGFEQIAQSPIRQSLTALTLRGATDPTGGDVPITASRMTTWGGLDGLVNLRNLRLFEMPLAAGAMGAFSDPACFPKLEQLTLMMQWNNLGDSLALGDLLRRGTLRSLELPMVSGFASGTWSAILNRAGPTPGLRMLNLHRCRLPDGEVGTLAQWPGLASVTRLSLGGNDLSADDLAALSQSPYTTGLQSLDLLRVGLDADEIDAIASGFTSGSLRELHLEALTSADPLATRQAAMRLLQSPATRGLRRLTLRSFILGDDGLRWLADRAELPYLEQLTLDRSAFTVAGLRSVLHSPRLRKLWRIHVAEMLGKWPPSPTFFTDGWQLAAAHEMICATRLG